MQLQNTYVHVVKDYIIRLHQFVPFLIDTPRLDQRVKWSMRTNAEECNTNPKVDLSVSLLRNRAMRSQEMSESEKQMPTRVI